MTCKKAIIFSLLLGVFFTQLAAAETEFRPAKFRDKDKIHEKIAFPRKGGDVSLIIPCKLYLPLSGRISSVSCHVKDRSGVDWLFERAIYDVLSTARMERAMVNGKAKSVWVYFMVAFFREGSEKSIEVHLNHGAEYDQFGIDYIGPQRLQPLNRILHLKKCKQNTNVWVKTVVETDGTASSAKIFTGTATERCKAALQDQYLRSSYIPAHHKGKPVKAMYYQSLAGRFGRNGVRLQEEKDGRL